MEDLQHVISALIKQYGWAAVQDAVNNTLKSSDTTSGSDPVPPNPPHP